MGQTLLNIKYSQKTPRLVNKFNSRPGQVFKQKFNNSFLVAGLGVPYRKYLSSEKIIRVERVFYCL